MKYLVGEKRNLIIRRLPPFAWEKKNHGLRRCVHTHMSYNNAATAHPQLCAGSAGARAPSGSPGFWLNVKSVCSRFTCWADSSFGLRVVRRQKIVCTCERRPSSPFILSILVCAAQNSALQKPDCKSSDLFARLSLLFPHPNGKRCAASKSLCAAAEMFTFARIHVTSRMTHFILPGWWLVAALINTLVSFIPCWCCIWS